MENFMSKLQKHQNVSGSIWLLTSTELSAIIEVTDQVVSDTEMLKTIRPINLKLALNLN